jgi:hypothetical protein
MLRPGRSEPVVCANRRDSRWMQEWGADIEKEILSGDTFLFRNATVFIESLVGSLEPVVSIRLGASMQLRMTRKLEGKLSIEVNVPET